MIEPHPLVDKPFALFLRVVSRREHHHSCRLLLPNKRALPELNEEPRADGSDVLAPKATEASQSFPALLNVQHVPVALQFAHWPWDTAVGFGASPLVVASSAGACCWMSITESLPFHYHSAAPECHLLPAELARSWP